VDLAGGIHDQLGGGAVRRDPSGRGRPAGPEAAAVMALWR
jgi:hypothetical protein